MTMRWGVAFALLCLLAGCASVAVPSRPGPEASARAPFAAPSPDGSASGQDNLQAPLVHATQVSDGSEPSILADRDGKAIWIGDTSGGYRSQDNGTTWSPMGNYALSTQLYAVDGWALAQDDSGSLYAGVLHDNRVDVARSADAGRTWNQVGYYSGVSGTADRPWLAAKGDGEVALFYFDAPTVAVGFSEHCARSTDGGLTFLDRDPLAVVPGQGGGAFYDSKGRLYFSSDTGSLYRFDTTCLGGSASIGMGSGLGVNNMIQSAADGTDLYMAAATEGSSAITLFGSHDGHSPKLLQVSAPELKSNTYATVAAHAGQVAVAWYGSTTSGDPSSAGFAGDFKAYLAVVDDFWGAPHVARYTLSATPNHRGQICMGGISCDITSSATRGLLDYFQVAYDRWGGLHVAYVDDHSGSRSVQYVHVAPAARPVKGSPPVADFTVRVQNRTASVDASSSRSPAASLLTYRWDWGDGSTGQGLRASHTYARFGSFAIVLTVTDASGAAATHATTIVIDGRSLSPPKAMWDLDPADPVAGAEITFQDRSTADTAATIHDASWEFGDGTTDTGTRVQHAFEAAGTYTVRLTVRDDHGGADSLARDVVVGNATSEATTTGPSSTTAAAHRSPALPLAALVPMVAAGALLRRRLRTW